MASCLDIVNGALRKIGVLAAGREARAVDRDDVFGSLKSLYRSFINDGAFGRLSDFTAVADFTATPNSRVFRNSDTVVTITLPELVNDLDTTLTPLDLSVIVICDAFTGETTDFVYDGHIKQWQSLYDLALTSPAPLSFRDEDGLKAVLAVKIVDEFSGNLGPATVNAAKRFQSALVSRYSMPEMASTGEYY